MPSAEESRAPCWSALRRFWRLPLPPIASRSRRPQRLSRPQRRCHRPAIEQAVALGQQGRCVDAMPVLRRALGHVDGKDLKQAVGAAGVRCAMFLDLGESKSNKYQEDATNFVNYLKHEFPNDPDVLYLAVHVYSDLSIRSAQELYARAPTSPKSSK